MTQDPFGNASGDVAGDPFGQPEGGGGKYPKAEDLLGVLLMISPIEITNVPKPPKFGGKPGEMVEQLTADTVVLPDSVDDLASAEEYHSMWWGQAGIVGAGKIAKRKGVPAILGRLWRFPVSEDKKDGTYHTRQDIEAAFVKFENRELKMPPRFAWSLEKFSPEDAEIARAYLANKKSPFGG